jgi:glycosyltransferase involved in cell wall biosynthesis
MRLLIKTLKKLYSIFPKKLVFGLINPILIQIVYTKKKKFQAGPLTIAGMLRAPTGLGKAARLTLEALKLMKNKVTSFDVTYLFTDKNLDIKLPPAAAEGEGGVIIIQNNPIHIPIILFLIGKEKLKYKKIIMYALWELETIPNSWIAPCSLVHEIWVPSQFILNAFQKSIKDKKIKLVPLFVTEFQKKEKQHKSNPSRSTVVMLSICNINSGFMRKNILETIDVFKKLSTQKEVVLIIHLTGIKGNEHYYDLIKNNIGNIDSIHISTDILSEKELFGLIDRADILLSLHRSEGFGLVLAEAMWLKKAIVATGWSGNTTFLPKDCALYVDYKLVDVDDDQGIYMSGSKWAQPNLEDAVQKLQLLIENPDLRKNLGKRAYEHACKFFNKENFTKWIADSLEIK